MRPGEFLGAVDTIHWIALKAERRWTVEMLDENAKIESSNFPESSRPKKFLTESLIHKV